MKILNTCSLKNLLVSVLIFLMVKKYKLISFKIFEDYYLIFISHEILIRVISNESFQAVTENAKRKEQEIKAEQRKEKQKEAEERQKKGLGK